MVDLRSLFDPNDILDVSHPSVKGFVNTYTDAYEALLTSDDEFEVARPVKQVRVSPVEFDRRLEMFSEAATEIKELKVGSVKAVLAFFDVSTYAIFALLLHDGKVGDYLVWPSPLGISPENALRRLFNKPLSDDLLNWGVHWCNSVISNDPVAYEVVTSDSREFRLLGHVLVEIIRDGAMVSGKPIKVG